MYSFVGHECATEHLTQWMCVAYGYACEGGGVEEGDIFYVG